MCSHFYLIVEEMTILLSELPHDTPVVNGKLLCGWIQDTPFVEDHKTIALVILESPHDTPIVDVKLLCGWIQDTPVVDDHKTIALVIHCGSI